MTVSRVPFRPPSRSSLPTIATPPSGTPPARSTQFREVCRSKNSNGRPIETVKLRTIALVNHYIKILYRSVHASLSTVLPSAAPPCPSPSPYFFMRFSSTYSPFYSVSSPSFRPNLYSVSRNAGVRSSTRVGGVRGHFERHS